MLVSVFVVYKKTVKLGKLLSAHHQVVVQSFKSSRAGPVELHALNDA
jgi:hypothetical protein